MFHVKHSHRDKGRTCARELCEREWAWDNSRGVGSSKLHMHITESQVHEKHRCNDE